MINISLNFYKSNDKIIQALPYIKGNIPTITFILSNEFLNSSLRSYHNKYSELDSLFSVVWKYISNYGTESHREEILQEGDYFCKGDDGKYYAIQKQDFEKVFTLQSDPSNITVIYP